MSNFENQHGRRPPFWKSLYLHISAPNRPNMTKFGVWTQIFTQLTGMWEILRNYQIQDGGRTPYWKSFLAISRFHFVRLRRNLEFGGLIARVQRVGDENVKFWKSNTCLLKFHWSNKKLFLLNRILVLEVYLLQRNSAACFAGYFECSFICLYIIA